MLIGKNESGEERLRKIVDTCEENDYKINCLVKLAEYYLQIKIEKSEELLKEAEKIDSTNPDVYYIRSQVISSNKFNIYYDFFCF